MPKKTLKTNFENFNDYSLLAHHQHHDKHNAETHNFWLYQFFVPDTTKYTHKEINKLKTKINANYNHVPKTQSFIMTFSTFCHSML